MRVSIAILFTVFVMITLMMTTHAEEQPKSEKHNIQRDNYFPVVQETDGHVEATMMVGNIKEKHECSKRFG